MKETKKSEIAAARYEAASPPLAIGGNLYHIDNDAQTAFLGTLIAMEKGALSETVWKLVDERFTTLNAVEFMTVATSVLAYIEQCFSRESRLIEAVNACATAEEISAVSW